MKLNNYYYVFYKPYANDELQVIAVCAKSKEEAINKVKEAGLIFTTDDYANNSGYIKNITIIKENFCL